ncbi:MAG: long-chain fatty acid--CoA ligase, partial [Treponema sp.]|nr:long-chain fatty acid--CoA ligase [Treponema sp.]
MLQYSDYISNLPDILHPNFIALLDAAEKNGDKPAVLYRSGKQREFGRWNYTRFAAECRRIGRGLLAAGLKKGDRVVLWAENRPEWMITWIGTVIAGLVIVPVDFLISEKECLNIIKITRARAFFYSGKKRQFAMSLEAEGIALDVSVCVSKPGEEGGVDEAFGAFGKDAGNQALPAVSDIDEHDPASIVFTSGTTG